MTASDVSRLAKLCGIVSNRAEPFQLLKFAEMVEQEERERCLAWVREVENVMRYSIAKISKTLSQSVGKEELHND